MTIVIAVACFFAGFAIGVCAPGSRRSIVGRLGWLNECLQASLHQGEQLMTVVEQINTKLDRIDTATKGIANDLRTLKDELAAGAPADLQGVLDRLEAAATSLEGLDAQTPDSPAADETTNS